MGSGGQLRGEGIEREGGLGDGEARGKKKGGPVDMWPNGGAGGGLARARAQAGAPRTRASRGRVAARSGGGSPGTVTPSHAWGRQGKREKGDSGGGWLVVRPTEWVPPVSEGRRGGRENGRWAPGCG
jgi:hypothetical protein